MKTVRPLPIILFTIFLDMLGIGILIPIIPQLLANPASPYYLLPSGSIQQGYILLGYLTAVYPLMLFFAAPILGQLSDRYGRKKVLALSILGTCISYIIFAYAIWTRNIPLLFISRAFDGLTAGNFAVAQAIIADITEPQERAKTFGYIGAAFGVGFILGPFLGGVLSNPELATIFTATTPFIFASILSAINALLVFTVLPETHANPDASRSIRWNQSARNIVRAFSFPSLRTLYLTTFIFQAGFGFFGTFFGVYLINTFGFDQGKIGNFFGYVGIWIIITQALINRNLVKRYNEQTLLSYSIIACGIAVMMYFLPREAWQLLLVVPLFAIANGISQANLSSLVSRSAGPEIQGEILGISASVQGMATTIPPLLSGYIAAYLNPHDPIVVSSVLIVCAGLFFILRYRPAILHQDPV